MNLFRTSRYRYIEYGDSSAKLYNYRDDPKYADALKMMREKLAKAHVK